MVYLRRLGAVLLSQVRNTTLCAVLGAGAADLVHSFKFREPSTLKVDGEKFELETDEALARLARRVELLGGERSIGKKDRRGLQEVVRLAEIYAREPSVFRQLTVRRQILEIASAIANNHRPPIPEYVGLPDLPFRFADSLSNPVARGSRPASNLMQSGGDLSKADPQPSSYWRRPAAIAAADLYTGFGREALPDFDDRVWFYAAPKTAGGNPGCELVSGSQRLKVKFAETHSEPFASRIFHALGYNVEATDYVRRLKVRYDRRLFTEFNMLPEIKMKIGLFFVPIHTFHFERTYDPFEFIESAVFNDGTKCSGKELKALLLLNPDRGVLTDNFRPEIESAIEHLVTVEANVQIDGEDGRSIGPWDFGGLGREHLRELRGAGVLAAWLGWWDARFDNTRLRLVKTASGVELRHFFSDLGAGLGRSSGTYRHSSEQPNEFEWVFTRGADSHFEIINYEPIEDTPAFKEITIDDARWMARLVSQLTEEQIVTALIASGFESAEVRIYTEKLISRRDQLIRDARLTDEIPLLRPNGIDRKITYDPMHEAAITARTVNGLQVQASFGTRALREGKVRTDQDSPRLY